MNNDIEEKAAETVDRMNDIQIRAELEKRLITEGQALARAIMFISSFEHDPKHGKRAMEVLDEIDALINHEEIK